MDFFVVPTATFRLLYVWFAVCHARRQVLHWSVTETPTARWVVQQLREAFPFDNPSDGRRFLLFDRDSIFSAEVAAAATSMTLEPVRTSTKALGRTGSPSAWQVPFGASCSTTSSFHQQHLQRLLREYWAYYQQDRTHLGIGKDAPLPRPVHRCSAGAATVHAAVRVGGLHHRYSWRAAA